MTPQEFIKKLIEYYSPANWNTTKTEIYVSWLDKCAPSMLEPLFVRVVETLKWFPKIHELGETLKEVEIEHVELCYPDIESTQDAGDRLRKARQALIDGLVYVPDDWALLGEEFDKFGYQHNAQNCRDRAARMM